MTSQPPIYSFDALSVRSGRPAPPPSGTSSPLSQLRPARLHVLARLGGGVDKGMNSLWTGRDVAIDGVSLVANYRAQLQATGTRSCQ
jgi:hypothetical protein